MNDKTRQLVEQIARQLIADLKQSDAATDQSTAPQQRAEVHPAIGTCTGNYSKFPELQGRLTGAEALKPSVRTNDGSTSQKTSQAIPDPIPLTGIITANQLQQAWGSSPDGVAVLADNARLTPLANDLARQHPQKICRESTIAGRRSVAVDADLPWMWWVDGPWHGSQNIIARRQPRFRPAAASHTPDSLGQVVRDLAAALKARGVAGGVLFVQNGAAAMCYTNRCPSIRAVLGTCGESVEQGIRDLGANVLVIEYPHIGPQTTEMMVDRIMQQGPTVPPQTQRDLMELHRSG